MKQSKKTLLWQLNHSTKETSSYLYGTMHVRDQRAFQYFEQCKKYISVCGVYAAEMDLEEAKIHGKPSDFLMPNGLSILDFISEKKWHKIRRQIIKSFSIDISPMVNMYPIFITNMIGESRLESGQSLALDQAMWNFAETNNLSMTGVESFADQMNTLRSLDIPTQIEQLKELARNPAKISKEVKQLANMYSEMDIQKLFKKSKKGMGNLRKKLIYKRNYKMTDKIFSLISDEATFIAIGAGHLAGQKGVLYLLKKKGVLIRPVRLKEV